MVALQRPITGRITQDFDGAFWMESPGYIKYGAPAARGKRVSFKGATYRKDVHLAIDYAAAVGTRVYAVAAGTVVNKGTDSSGGTFLVIRIRRGLRFQLVARYYHLSRVIVAIGQKVTRGQLVAYSGDAGGRSTGGHLHFELRRGYIWQSAKDTSSWMKFDPQPFIDGTASIYQIT